MSKHIIHNIFEESVNRFPDNVAITSGNSTVTYKNLNMVANSVAHALTGFCKGRPNIVGVFLEASVEYVAAIMGILKAGLIFMPINLAYPAKRFETVFEQTRPSIIVANKNTENLLYEKLGSLKSFRKLEYIIVFDEAYDFIIKRICDLSIIAKNLEFPDSNLSTKSVPDDGCYVLTTSGSAGTPKAVLGNFKGLSHFIQWETRQLGLDQRDKISFLSPVVFDVSLRDIFIPLCTGGTLCIPDEDSRRNPLKMAQWIERNRISLIHIVPTLLRLMIHELIEAENMALSLSSLKYVLVAGEALYGNDVINARKVLAKHVEFINLYGPSETTLAKLFYKIRDRIYQSGEMIPIGKPIADTEVLIIKNQKICPPGTGGEIYIKSNYMTNGYLNAPELNKASFIPNPIDPNSQEMVFKTGDMGEYMPDGNVKILGRLDNQIKLNGIRVELGEIEVILRQHDNIREATVVTGNDNYGNLRLIAYVVPIAGKDLAVEILRDFLKHRLPDYMIPSIFVNMESLPLTHSGKINRRALPSPPKTRPEIAEPFISPSDSIEVKLSEIWCQILDIDRVGINDNFFDLGGTSLLAARLAGRISDVFGIELPVIKLFKYPTINNIAEYLIKGEKKNHSFEKVKNRAMKRKSAVSKRRQLRKSVKI